MGNSTGIIFKITTFGESHGTGVGVVIDGCPPGHKIDLEFVQSCLNRRKPGQSHLTSPRKENDLVECLSGLYQGVSLGTPIALLVRNQDFKSEHYQDLAKAFRPSHGDFTFKEKYGINPLPGGGRLSARETIGRVAGGAVAYQILKNLIPNFEVLAYVDEIKGIKAIIEDRSKITFDLIEQNALRCPASNWKQLEAEVLACKRAGDTVGGVIYCEVRSCPTGLGDPVFDKLEANLGKAILSLPACKGIEFGSGFSGTLLNGSQHNDAFYIDGEKVRTKTNFSGGIQGGISNGENITIRAAFKPVATIFKNQDTVTISNEEINMKPKAGRHDPCVLPRAAPMVEAMVNLIIIDHYLKQLAQFNAKGSYHD